MRAGRRRRRWRGVARARRGTGEATRAGDESASAPTALRGHAVGVRSSSHLEVGAEAGRQRVRVAVRVSVLELRRLREVLHHHARAAIAATGGSVPVRWCSGQHGGRRRRSWWQRRRRAAGGSVGADAPADDPRGEGGAAAEGLGAREERQRRDDGPERRHDVTDDPTTRQVLPSTSAGFTAVRRKTNTHASERSSQSHPSTSISRRTRGRRAARPVPVPPRGAYASAPPAPHDSNRSGCIGAPRACTATATTTAAGPAVRDLGAPPPS